MSPGAGVSVAGPLRQQGMGSREEEPFSCGVRTHRGSRARSLQDPLRWDQGRLRGRGQTEPVGDSSAAGVPGRLWLGAGSQL